MNLSNKKKDLMNLVSKYINNECSLDELNNFSWEVIGYFNGANKTKLPPCQDNENEFWYTIWEIQHLADSEHEKDGTTKRVLSEALSYLKKERPLPRNYKGNRP
jgi:hypothetical protein